MYFVFPAILEMCLHVWAAQFVHTNNNGNIEVSPRVWILAAIAIPLTAVTEKLRGQAAFGAYALEECSEIHILGPACLAHYSPRSHCDSGPGTWSTLSNPEAQDEPNQDARLEELTWQTIMPPRRNRFSSLMRAQGKAADQPFVIGDKAT